MITLSINFLCPMFLMIFIITIFTVYFLLTVTVMSTQLKLLYYCYVIYYCYIITSGLVQGQGNKKFELMLTRCAKAYSSSSCSQTVSLSLAISSQFILGVCAAAKDHKNLFKNPLC